MIYKYLGLSSLFTGYHGDNSSTSSRPSSGQPAVNAPTKRTQRNVDSSTSITSIGSEDKRRARRNVSQMLSDELPTRKGTPQNEMDQVVRVNPVNRKYESPVSLPMWLNVKNMEIINQGKTSTSVSLCSILLCC